MRKIAGLLAVGVLCLACGLPLIAKTHGNPQARAAQKRAKKQQKAMKKSSKQQTRAHKAASKH